MFLYANYFKEQGYEAYVLTDDGQPPDWIELKADMVRRSQWKKRIKEEDIVVFSWDYDIEYILQIKGKKCCLVQHFIHRLEDIFKLPLDIFISESKSLVK